MNGKKDIILIAAFGMGRAADYRATLDKLRQEIGNEWPDHLVYACATSGRMRAALAEQNLFLPAPEQVLSLFAGQGGRALTVLPTQLLPGADYARLTDAVRQNFAGPARLLPPLLGEETGRAALARHLAALPDGGGQTLWMGHGSEEGRADALYAQMEGGAGRHRPGAAPGGHGRGGAAAGRPAAPADRAAGAAAAAALRRRAPRPGGPGRGRGGQLAPPAGGAGV